MIAITMKLYLEKRVHERADDFKGHRRERAEEGKDKPAREDPKDTSIDSATLKTAMEHSNGNSENGYSTKRIRNHMTMRNYTRKCSKKSWRKKWGEN